MFETHHDLFQEENKSALQLCLFKGPTNFVSYFALFSQLDSSLHWGQHNVKLPKQGRVYRN